MAKNTQIGIKNGIRINIEDFRGKVRLRWTYEAQRFTISLNAQYTLDNIKKAEIVANGIISDIERGVFDKSLVKYKPSKNIPTLKLKEEYKNWVSLQGYDLDKNGTHYQIFKMVDSWGNFKYSDICILLDNGLCNARTFNIRLRVLNKFFAWLLKTGKLSFNPIINVEKKVTKKSTSSERDPLSPTDVIRVLDAVKNNTFSPKFSNSPHSYYYPFLYFIALTGVRNQEAIGLKVKYIDLKRNIITIAEAFAMYAGKPYKRYWKDTKNYKVREIPLTSDLREILLPLVKDKDPEDLVFTSPRGSFINDRNFQVRILKPILKGLGLPDKHLYAFRHSFASRALEQGLNILTTSYLMGNNPDTMLKHYAKIINKPKDLPGLK